MDPIEKLLRDNIRDLVPYSSARNEYSGEAAIFLDANENPYGEGFNRYPDPLQTKLKKRLGQIKNLDLENIFLGNGSDEAIDLLIRSFCEPGKDNIVGMSPSYGMYKVCADISDVEYREVSLRGDLQLDKSAMLKAVDDRTKLIFLCSPNNPTSNNLFPEDIIYLLDNFKGLLILDEAYIDFSGQASMLSKLPDYPNLVVLQTLSKAWGMAGIRLGICYAARGIIRVLNKVKAPYNVNELTQRYALERLEKLEEKDQMVKDILDQREFLRIRLPEFRMVKEILPSDANFLMVRLDQVNEVFRFLIDRKIIVRDRSKVHLCEGCLRFTIGTEEENRLLLKALQDFEDLNG